MKNNKGKIVVLMGMSGVGKDATRKILEEDMGYENIVSYTSRPIRENEIEDKDYHFVTRKQFENMINNNEMIEYRSYETNWNGNTDTWFYGVKKFELEDYINYVIVIDLMGAESIIRYFGEENCIPIYLCAKNEIRKARAIRRGSFDETEWNRRLLADYKDFSMVNLNNFMRKYKVWEIENDIHGEYALGEIADVIDFIRQGRLY